MRLSGCQPWYIRIPCAMIQGFGLPLTSSFGACTMWHLSPRKQSFRWKNLPVPFKFGKIQSNRTQPPSAISVTQKASRLISNLKGYSYRVSSRGPPLRRSELKLNPDKGAQNRLAGLRNRARNLGRNNAASRIRRSYCSGVLYHHLTAAV